MSAFVEFNVAVRLLQGSKLRARVTPSLWGVDLMTVFGRTEVPLYRHTQMRRSA